jgi:hypothetical protein
LQDFIWIGGLQFGNRQQYLDGRLDEVKFFTRVLDEAEIRDEMRPDKRIAFLIEPAVGTVLEQEIPVLLAWVPGDGVTAHNVYVGTDEAQLPLVAPAHPDTVYDAAPLMPGPYFWQIGEIQADGAEVKGDIWSFAIADYLVVDDFEDYNDFPPSEIFNSWIDGWNIPANGSTVGYPNPDFSAGEHYVEITVVHEGAQSMPFFYDNDLKYSEATLTLTSGRDWTRLGVSMLSLWFRGHAASVGSFAEGPVGTYTVTGSGADIWNEADAFHYVYKELSGPGSIIAKVESIENTHNWAKAGVMIRDSLDADSAHGIMLVSAAQGVAFQRRSIAGQSTIGTTEAGLRAAYWVKIERDISGMMSASHSADGISWTPLGNEIINMNTPAYIGLAVTSHDADAISEAVFSNVQITGSVSPQWTSQDIGMINNDPELMYVAVADGAGPTATVYHDNPNAAQMGTWTEWNIELKSLADQGIDLTDVDNLSIGFGDADNLQAGGSGLVFFDDIRLK